MGKTKLKPQSKPKSRPVAVLFADSHLQERTWKMRPITGDAYFAFSQICAAAIDMEVSWLIGAGDLINRRVNEPGPILVLKQQLDELSRAGVKFAYIQGQHEMDDNPWLRLGGANAVHLHRQCIVAGDAITLYGLDFQPAGKLQEELAVVPKYADILVAHQVWSNFMGEVALPQGSFEDVENVETLVTGDYHQYVLSANDFRRKDGEVLRVCSPGATHMLNISEPTQHSFCVLHEDGSISQQALRSRVCETYSIMTPSQLDAFLGTLEAALTSAAMQAGMRDLPEQLQKPLWRVVYSHRLSDLPSRIGKIVGDRAHLFWKEVPPAADDEPDRSDAMRLQAAAAQSGETITLASCLPQELNEEQEPEEFALAQRLLLADEPAAELVRWQKEVMT